MTEKTETITKILRIVRTVLYIVWLLLMLLVTTYLTIVVNKDITVTQTYIYKKFDPFTFGWIFSVLNIETALVIFRKYNKLLGFFHILLGFFCLVLTCCNF